VATKERSTSGDKTAVVWIIGQSGELGLIGSTGMVGTIFTVTNQSNSKVTINQWVTTSKNIEGGIKLAEAQ